MKWTTVSFGMRYKEDKTLFFDLNLVPQTIWRHDIQHNDIQSIDIQHNDTQHNDAEHNNKYKATLSIMVVFLCCVSCMLSVLMLNVVM
jgi:hypothetical protein